LTASRTFSGYSRGLIGTRASELKLTNQATNGYPAAFPQAARVRGPVTQRRCMKRGLFRTTTNHQHARNISTPHFFLSPVTPPSTTTSSWSLRTSWLQKQPINLPLVSCHSWQLRLSDMADSASSNKLISFLNSNLVGIWIAA
jgi:hypothetical protein